MFFSKPTISDIRYRLDNLVDDFDHSDLNMVISDIKSIIRDSSCSSTRASHLNDLIRELSRCESGSELSGTRYYKYLDRAERN